MRRWISAVSPAHAGESRSMVPMAVAERLAREDPAAQPADLLLDQPNSQIALPKAALLRILDALLQRQLGRTQYCCTQLIAQCSGC